MSIQVANINLAGAIVGQTGKILFGQAIPPPTITQQMRPQAATPYRLVIQDESGCGLTCLFPLTRKTFSIRAGDGRIIGIPPGEQELDYVVSYVLPNAPVAQLLVDMYIPGEEVDALGTLGNSPIGLSGGVVTGLSTKIPIDTTGGDIVGIEFGPDAHSLSDWEFVCLQTGDFALRDNKNGRVLWVGRLSSGSVDFPFAAALNVAGNVALNNGTSDSPRFFMNDPINNDIAGWSVTAEKLRALASYRGGGFSELGGFTLIDGKFFAMFAIGSIGGQATAGSFGVAPIVASVFEQHITATGLTTIYSASLPAGMYEVCGAFALNNGTPGQLVTFQIVFPGRVFGSNTEFLQILTSSLAFHTVNGAQSLSNLDWVTWPRVFVMTAGTLTISYNDPGGTPNDFVSVVVKRLA